MSSSNGTETPDLIRETLQPLVDHRETVAQELNELEAAVSGKKEELKRINQLLRTGGLVEPSKKSTKAQRAAWVSSEMLDHARGKLPDGQFTIRDLTGRMEVSEATVRKVVDVLRDRRELRLVGMRIGNNGHNAAHYEVVS